jgi:hypothetical protein
MKARRCIAIAAFAAIGLGGTMAAQAQQSGLVNVDVSNLRADIAKDINVDVSQIPVNVQVPVGVAANVCGVDANVLARQDKGSSPACQAKNKSQALNQQVQRQLVAQK